MPSSYALGDHFEQFIRQQVETGRYASASELVRKALHLLETRERLREIEIQQFRENIRAGMQSGSCIPADEVFNRLEAKYQAMSEQQS
jgi:antitoxin ParD1/3/4